MSTFFVLHLFYCKVWSYYFVFPRPGNVLYIYVIYYILTYDIALLLSIKTHILKVVRLQAITLISPLDSAYNSLTMKLYCSPASLNWLTAATYGLIYLSIIARQWATDNHSVYNTGHY